MENQTPKVKIEIPVKEKHDNIYAALSAFQGELKPMKKNGTVEFETSKGDKVKFNYTPLGDIMAEIYPLLKKHGLAVRHEITDKGVEAILTHETYEPGHIVKTLNTKDIDHPKVEETITLPIGEIRSGIIKISYGAQMKDTGAAITYARRYTLTMVLGISSEDDKDAELLEQSAKNAIQTVYTRFKAGIEKATTITDLEKQMGVLGKDLANLEKGKAPALGLIKEQYEELIAAGTAKAEQLTKEATK